MQIQENRAIVKQKVTAKDGLMHLALSAMCLSSKNIYNTALFHIRNAFLLNSLSDYDVPLEHMLTALLRYNTVIAKINAARSLRATDKPPKLLSLIDKGNAPTSVLLDPTVLDTLIRDYCPDYKAIPATSAQQVLRQVGNNFKAYFKALADYAKSPAKYKARPRKPHYLGKYSLNYLRFNAVAGKVSLGSLKNRTVYLDYERTTTLPQEAIDGYDSFDVTALITYAKSRYTNSKLAAIADSLKCVEIRVIPKRGQFVLECVFELPVTVADNSLLGQVATQYATASDRPVKDFFKLSLKKQSEIIKAHVTSMVHMPATAGIDLGMANLATVAYSTGNRGSVYSGNRFNARMRAIDKRLDLIKSATMSQSALELDVDSEEVSDAQLSEYYTELNKVYANPEYRELLADKAALTSSMLHKLSTAIVTQAKLRGIELIVIGKNEGWKTEVNLGKRNNREFHNIPHAKLIELIRYKARELSIAVVVTEEAYTSKASFVLSDAIPPKAPSESTACSGIRNSHRYSIIKSLKDKVSLKWQTIHADINGAFNMIRKVVKQFSFENHLTPKFRLIYSRSDFTFTPLA